MPTYDNAPVKQLLIRFLSGEMEITEFRRLYDENPEINDYLQGIIDRMKAAGEQAKPYPLVILDSETLYSEAVPYLLGTKETVGLAYQNRYDSVRQCLTYEFRMFTHDVETADGASAFYSEVYEIFYQEDQSVPFCYRYENAYGFAMDVIPQYLTGGEAEHYIQREILPRFPETMKKTERKKGVKAAIKAAFPSEKGYPAWAQNCQWPMDKTGKPATYIGKGKIEGDLRRYRFRDETDGEIIVIEQYY